MGLRELKKEQTRARIADVAWQLFAERGFDPVKVAEIARAAQVSEATVFNYFPTKEDLFFARLAGFESALLDAVRTRAPEESALAAMERFLLHQPGGLLARVQSGDDEALAQLRTVNRMIVASPALQAREQRTMADAAAALAAQLAAEAGAPPEDVVAQVAANAMMGVHHALVGLVRRRILSGDAPDRLAADIRTEGARAFALLRRGLAAAQPEAE